MGYMFGTFDAIPKRKHITFFKLGKLWVFKNSFLITEWSLMRCWTITTKTYTVSSSDLPARGGFDYDLVENLKGYVVELPKISEICTDPEKLRGLQGNRERADIPDEGSGGGRGSCGPRRKNSRRRDCLQIKW